ncbi:hypothetical protein F4861DRAFT_510592 [Xylaria intraflava]|nr:hypothetical protein F4861DRAFT_510592 [Xylaria intraflava]
MRVFVRQVNVLNMLDPVGISCLYFAYSISDFENGGTYTARMILWSADLSLELLYGFLGAELYLFVRGTCIVSYIGYES